jgi:integrase/recombinase XerD
MEGVFILRQNQFRRLKRETKSAEIGSYAYSISEMFEQFMLIKKGEGLAKRTIKEYYNNFQYFMDYIGRELPSKEMTTEVFSGWISYMCEEMDYSPATVNIRVRTMRSFLRYIYEDKQWIQEPVHKRFKPIKAPIDNVEAFTPEEFKRLIGAIDDSSYTGFRTKVILFVLIDTMVRVSELFDIKRKNVDFKNLTIQLEAADTKVRVARTFQCQQKQQN